MAKKKESPKKREYIVYGRMSVTATVLVSAESADEAILFANNGDWRDMTVVEVMDGQFSKADNNE
jgi:hypothetical protein